MDSYPPTKPRELPGAIPAAQIAVFLDFDGTLVELAERPELVAVPTNLPDMLRKLERRLGGALAIVTGRPLDVVDDMLVPARLTVAAAHGTEGRMPGGVAFGPSPAAVAEAERIFEELTKMVRAEPRLILEKKAGAVALHFRQAPELENQCRAAIRAAVAESAFSIVEGKSVFEARPSGTDKGTAIQSLMQQLPFRGRMPIFMGDDRTDEDGFAAVRTLGGFGVKVGAGATLADYRTSSVESVRQLLVRWAEDDLALTLDLAAATPGSEA